MSFHESSAFENTSKFFRPKFHFGIRLQSNLRELETTFSPSSTRYSFSGKFLAYGCFDSIFEFHTSKHSCWNSWCFLGRLIAVSQIIPCALLVRHQGVFVVRSWFPKENFIFLCFIFKHPEMVMIVEPVWIERNCCCILQPRLESLLVKYGMLQQRRPETPRRSARTNRSSTCVQLLVCIFLDKHTEWWWRLLFENWFSLDKSCFGEYAG